MNPLDKDHDPSAIEIFSPATKGYAKDMGKTAWDAEFTPIIPDHHNNNEKSAEFNISPKMDFLNKVENLKESYKNEEEYQTPSQHHNFEHSYKSKYKGSSYDRSSQNRKSDDEPEYRKILYFVFFLILFNI